MHPSVDTPTATTTVGRLRKRLGAWLALRGAQTIEPPESQSEKYTSLSIDPVANRGTLAAVKDINTAGSSDPHDATELSIAVHRTSTTTEGWVEQISQCGDGSEVRLALADGTPVKLCLEEGDVEWLGLGVNQIVTLQRTPALSA
jgi:hypothetical protein